jgi:serine/threonine protein kinase
VSSGDPLGVSGTNLHEQFRVNELADETPRAFLYKGTQLANDTQVAIKFLKVPHAVDAEAFVKRFRHESRLHFALAQASPHVVKIHAAGSTTPKATHTLTPFSVLEWLHGRTLAADFAERRAHWGKGRSVEEAINLLDPAVEALAIAHSHNVVHREVTPANLFLAEERDEKTIKVLDFGLAKVLGDSMLGDAAPDELRARTVDLGPLASPIYAAPEQFSRDAGSVGPAADLYSLIMIFLEALRDKPVMDEATSPLAVRVLDAKKRPTPRALGIEVGENLELAIAEAVAVKASARPREIGEFWANLKRAALKDLRVVSISAPPNMRSRSDSEDDATDVAISLSFMRPSRAETVPHPEPATLSRPFDETESLSSTGEMFAMLVEIEETEVVDTPLLEKKETPHKETLLSPGQTSERRIVDKIKPTLVSGVPPSTKTEVMPRETAQPSTATPFALAKKNETPVVPMTEAFPENPRDALKRVALHPAAEEAVPQPMPPTRSPWVTALLVFVICATGLTAIVAILLR